MFHLKLSKTSQVDTVPHPARPPLFWRLSSELFHGGTGQDTGCLINSVTKIESPCWGSIRCGEFKIKLLVVHRVPLGVVHILMLKPYSLDRKVQSQSHRQQALSRYLLAPSNAVPLCCIPTGDHSCDRCVLEMKVSPVFYSGCTLTWM